MDACFTIGRAVSELCSVPLTWAFLSLAKSSQDSKIYRGVRIMHYGTKSEQEEFAHLIQQGLDLVFSIDLRRFQRILRNVELVTRKTPKSVRLAEANCRSHIIDINTSRLALGVRETRAVEKCASILVHEATHIEINRRGIAYLPSNRRRIERLCRNEELRFARKVKDPELYFWVIRRMNIHDVNARS